MIHPLGACITKHGSALAAMEHRRKCAWKAVYADSVVWKNMYIDREYKYDR